MRAQVPEAATLLAPGPEDGTAARLAGRAAAALARGLVRAAALRVSVLGGPDGITAANRFASSSVRDGQMLLLLPGLAAQAQLVGDSRARFEPRHWPAICGSMQPSLLALRRAPAAGAPLRIAVPAAAAPEAGALLALELLGQAAVPVFCPATDATQRQATSEAAVAQGGADGLVLSGTGAERRALELGLAPRFAFDAAGHARDAALPGVPALGEMLPDPARADLLEAVRACGAALRARAILVLPTLTSANVVALWRGAAQTWPEEAPDAPEAGTRRIGPAEATALLTTLCPAPDAALAYRLWLLRRLGFQAS
ncbi:hypothetical protein [Falsiroseomonas tokyonensis]|uniref:Uncharacterized protein n=1 Tax=Falsiroseomonas tokyonensis TaxID=430521 RepID=A0ABV7BYS4_9PROT|nr:hypothetical protein [Falsiroseomonas tokyonensis]MBU8540786.1 hypothetical protein [Falsiroseomonas tokyonensis]